MGKHIYSKTGTKVMIHGEGNHGEDIGRTLFISQMLYGNILISV